MGTEDPRRDLEAVIKSTATIVAQPPGRPNPGDQDPGKRPNGGLASGQVASLDLNLLALVFLEAALAVDLIAAPISHPKRPLTAFGSYYS